MVVARAAVPRGDAVLRPAVAQEVITEEEGGLVRRRQQRARLHRGSQKAKRDPRIKSVLLMP